jgi:hypothetical protein
MGAVVLAQREPQQTPAPKSAPSQVAVAFVKVSKVALAVLALIGAIFSLAIGIAISPFSSEIGVGALGISTGLFGVAGYLWSDQTT